MTQFDIDFKAPIMSESDEINKQLRIANELKALELKLKYPDAINMVDDIANQI